MGIVLAGNRLAIAVPAHKALTIVADAVSSGTAWQLGETVGSQPGRPTTLAADTTTVIGPFSSDTRFEIVTAAGQLTYSTGRVDFPTTTENAAAYAPKLGSDVLDLVGAGAPVDYTDGDPAATGEGTAGPGSRYTDVTGANLYINGGTKAEPVWKLVTRAA